MKTIYKLSTVFVTACMFAVMGMGIMAADETNLNENTSSGNTTVNAKTTIPGEPSYTVTIPGDIVIGDIQRTTGDSISSTSFDVVAEGLSDLNGKSVSVKVSSTEGNFNLKNGSYLLPYEVYNKLSGGEKLAINDEFANFTTAGKVTGRVDINCKNIKAEGAYTDNMTFDISLK